MPGKFIEEVKKAILSAASDYDRERLSAPVALLWTDHNREWEPVVEKLVKDHGMPIATFGSYDPEEFKGVNAGLVFPGCGRIDVPKKFVYLSAYLCALMDLQQAVAEIVVTKLVI